MAQDPDFIARFRDYNDYLDSLIAEEDIRYLQDGELARLIAELSYRGAGRTLTEREYNAEIYRIEMAKKLKEINENSAKEGDMLGRGKDDGPLVTAIKARYKDNKEGRLHSVFYIILRGVEDEEEVAGHIDLAERIQLENFLPYLTGSKQLMPRPRDLTYCNWASNKTRWGSSAHWEVVAGGPRLVLRHRTEGVQVTVGPVAPVTHTQQKWRSLKTKLQAPPKLLKVLAGGERVPPAWIPVETNSRSLRILCLDLPLTQE
jgi:hypothetical protein